MNRRRFLSRAGLAGIATASVKREEAAPLELPDEPPLEANLPMVDAHHHLWDFPAEPGYPVGRYLLPELLADIRRSGHLVTHTVFAECGAMYRATGPVELRPVGETEFVNGIAAMATSGRYGPCRVAAAIIGTADLSLGEAVEPVLEAQIAAGDGRFRGVRIATAYAEVPVFGQPPNPALKGLLLDPKLRAGAKLLGRHGLSWDIWVFDDQLDEVASVASGVPDTQIVLDHVGRPLLMGVHAGQRDSVFAKWKRGIEEVARRPNVVVKLGGLGMDFSATIGTRHRHATSEELVPEWRPYIETCIAAFGVDRCMFESNVPPDAATCSYGTIWNTFKRITMGYSLAEKAALYRSNAKRVYRLRDGESSEGAGER